MPSTPRGQRTRARIIEAAIRVMGEKGIAGTRVEEVTRRAGCGYGTFYKYFASKIDLVRQVMTEVYGEIHRESFASLPEGIPDEETIRSGIERTVRSIQKHREVLLALERAVGLDPELLELRNRLLHQDVEELERRMADLESQGFELGLDPFAASLALNSMVEEMSRRWLYYEDRLSEKTFIETLVRIFQSVLLGGK